MRLPAATSTGAVTRVAAVIALAMIAQQVASKAVRDGLFLTYYDVTALPTAAAAAAAVSLVAALLLGRVISALTPGVAVPVLFGLNGVIFLSEAALIGSAPRVVAAAVYVHTAALGAAVVSGFWSVVNERFDPYTARQVMGTIATGATVGGLVGGVSTWLLSDVSPTALLAVLGAVNWVCGLALLSIARHHRAHEHARTPSGFFEGFAVLRDFGYPRLLAVLVLLCALMSAVVDYVFKAGVTAAGSSLVGFFGLFYAGTGIASFVVQSTVTSRLLKSFGVVAALTLLPALALAGISTALVVPALGVLVLLRGALMVVENSVHRSAYELLYTSVPAAQKRSGKMLIDLGSDRLGTAVGSGLVAASLAIAATSASTLLLGIGLLVAAAFLGVIALLRRQYMGALASSLRQRQAQVAATDPGALAYTFGDAADRIPWQDGPGTGTAGTAGAGETFVDRPTLVAAVRARAAEKRAELATPAALHPVPAQVADRLVATPLAAQLSEVAPGSATWRELEWSAAAMVGQLGDIALSARHPLAVRLAAVELLSTVPSARVIALLVALLDAPDLRLRRIAALGLLRLRDVVPALMPSPRVLSPRAVAALRHPALQLDDETPLERWSPFRADAAGRRFAPAFELAMTLLAVGGDTGELQLAISAATSDDPTQRGTGLEYLDSLLPGGVRAQILALAASPSRSRRARRITESDLRELAGELREGRITLEGLRRRHRALADALFGGPA